MTRSRRSLLIACGSMCVGLGVVGVVLPVLPTTPFLLLAVYVFARSSARLHHRLVSNRLVGSYLRGYLEGGSMTQRHKAATLALLWSTLSATAALLVDAWWLRGVLAAVGIAVTTHLLSLRSPSSRDVRKAPDG